MVQTDTLANSTQSEPPDIKNWFSSYEYESLVLETNDNFGFSDNLETQSFDKDCTTPNTLKPIENSSEKNDGMMHKECTQSGDENMSQNYVSDSEDSYLLSPVEESEPPGIDNWFSSYVYESLEVDDLILSAHEESIIERSGKLPLRTEVEKDKSLCETDDLICNQNAESDANVNSFEKAEIPSCGTDWSEENRNNKDEDVGNGFVSIRRKRKRENDENSMSVDQKKYAMKKGDEKAKRRTTLGDVTNIEHSSVTGKWKCTRLGKPDVGPPLKQLRLGQWFHYV